MKGFKGLVSRVGLIGLAAVALAAMTAKAALIDDCEGGTNQNQFGAYWYFYDDSADGGNTKIAGVTRDGKNLLGVAPIAGEGNAGTAGYKMSYTMGTVLAPCKDATGAVIPSCGFNYAGVGTMLATEGLTCDIKTAQTITFWAKASPAVKLNVEVATSDITDFGYYRTLISIGTSWAKYQIVLDPDLGIQQPQWAKTVTFDPKKVQKIQWQVHSDQVKGAFTDGTVNIDDVTIEPYDFVPPEVCVECLTAAAPATKALLSDFEGAVPNVNAAGQYWYCYNDGDRMPAPTKVSDYSDINAGITVDPALPIGKSPLIAIEGHGKTGSGAYIGYLLGPTFTQTGSADVIKPFVGVGTKLSDDLGSVFYNATADGATGVMFDYKITGASYLRFEVVSSNDMSSSGIVWSRLFPAGADWQTAVVPFSALALPNWASVQAMDPATTALKLNELKKMQWAVQDGAGKSGTIAIDNIYLIGATKVTKLGSGVLYHKGSMAATGLKAGLVNRSLVLTMPSSLGQQNGSISLVNIKGVRIAGKAVNVMAGSAANLDVSNVANGMYFAVIKTKNTSGKEFSATIPVNIY